VIVGGGGQDGRLLHAKLQKLGYTVTTVGRHDFDITDPGVVKRFLEATLPTEVYFLAAHHHSSEQLPKDEQGQLFRLSNAIHFTAALNFVDGIAAVSPRTRLFYASSSLIYSPSQASDLLSEATAPQPAGAYAITKTAGMWVCRHYRETVGVFASVGILFNHESKFRKKEFLSRKIVETAVRIKLGLADRLELGDLRSQVDWGFAPDYVEAMYSILQLEAPDDFVVATGELHTVEEFVEYAFGVLGLDYRKYTVVNPASLTRVNSARRGDSTKLQETCSWRPTYSFKAMVEELVREEVLAIVETVPRDECERPCREIRG
jgi:GDPmannose 4,6-dehydratase